jgi:hypothetical protein
MLVLDASVALALLDRIAESRATVPWHWWLEVGNGLVVARRRRRLRREAVEPG